MVDRNSFHVKNGIQILAELFALPEVSENYQPRVFFVTMGRPVRGGTHQKVKIFVEAFGRLRNITGHVGAVAGIPVDTFDLSMVIHRDTIMFRNMADKFPELASLRNMFIDWQ